MSWYAEIYGAVDTSRDAYPMVLRGLGPWLKRSMDGGSVEVGRENGRLSLLFGNVYRNLGSHLPTILWRIARRFPRATRGTFTIMSIDGCFFAAEYRVQSGRVYRRALADKEEEWRPARVKAARGERSGADR